MAGVNGGICAMNTVNFHLPAASIGEANGNATFSLNNISVRFIPQTTTRHLMRKSPCMRSQPEMPLVYASSLLDEQHFPQFATQVSLMDLLASKTQRLTEFHQQLLSSGNSGSLDLFETNSSSLLADSLTNAQIVSQIPRLEPSTSFESVAFQPVSSYVTGAAGASAAAQSPILLPRSPCLSRRNTPKSSASNRRKRPTRSIHGSPALLPKLFPNISPSLPKDLEMSAKDQALSLLITKSAYQNILEGNQIPGVTYPSELSSNFASKRISRKIAEQGRRNRIKSALQVMVSLLPENKINAPPSEHGNEFDAKSSHPLNSKAAVVENAIVHMKSLKKENEALRQELQILTEQFDTLKGSIKRQRCASTKRQQGSLEKQA